MKGECECLHGEKDLLNEIVLGHAVVNVRLHHVVSARSLGVEASLYITSRKAFTLSFSILNTHAHTNPLDEYLKVGSSVTTYCISRPKPT